MRAREKEKERESERGRNPTNGKSLVYIEVLRKDGEGGEGGGGGEFEKIKLLY